MRELYRHFKQSYTVMTLAQVNLSLRGPAAGVLDRGNKLGKCSYSCGNFYNDFICEDKE